MTAPTRIAVLASGRGSNLQAILDAIAAGRLPAEVVGVFSDRPAAAALQRVGANLRWAHAPKEFDDRAAYEQALWATHWPRLRAALRWPPGQHPPVAAALAQGAGHACAGTGRRRCRARCQRAPGRARAGRRRRAGPGAGAGAAQR
uniref:phosphoribosylglycinamide formyltransferase 1 n=1 Tax=Panagrolaimus superbus TaxID=310955 RepID=A0A914Y0J0_9BILA